MAGELQPLAQNFKIVNADGFPTQYFIKWAQQRQLDIKNGVPDDRQVIAGTGLAGGGDLSENITLDLDDTAVTPGVYGDATHSAQLTIDQQGRVTDAVEVPISGGGGGGSLEVSPIIPVLADFTWQNQGTAVATDTPYGLELVAPAAGSQIRFLQYTGAATPAAFKMRVRAQSINRHFTAGYSCCLIARESATGRIAIAGMYNMIQYLIQAWNSYSGYAGNVWGPDTIENGNFWYQMEMTATDLRFSWSPNGYSWYEFQVYPHSSFLTLPDQFGIGVMANADVGSVFQSFEIV